jgi:hypothetical protein
MTKSLKEGTRKGFGYWVIGTYLGCACLHCIKLTLNKSPDKIMDSSNTRSQVGAAERAH